MNLRPWKLRKTDHPYPMSQLRQLKCVRCGAPGHSQWKICSDGAYRVFCIKCDASMNALILHFAKHAKWKVLMQRYPEQQIAELEKQVAKLQEAVLLATDVMECYAGPTRLSDFNRIRYEFQPEV